MSDTEDVKLLFNQLPVNAVRSSDEDEIVSVGSSATSRSKSPTARRRKKRKSRKSKTEKTIYKFTRYMREDHGQPLFGVKFNNYLPEKQAIFASVGANRISIYECLQDEKGSIDLLLVFADPDVEENYYTCAWSYDTTTKQPLIAVAGMRGVIRVIDISKVSTRHYIGHGQAVNELKFHPKLPQLLVSASKDHSLRLWNIETQVCVAIFSGVEGHRDEVLSVDFDAKGTCIMSAGMDHSLKLWSLEKDNITQAIKNSLTNKEKNSRYTTWREHFPDFSTRDVHRNYVDCVQWFGNFLLSKSCENEIVCWKRGDLDDAVLKPSDTTVLHRFPIKDCDIWFIRFEFNFAHKIMALGNQQGITYVWEMGVEDPQSTKCHQLAHLRCNTAIRQTTFSRNGNILICVCDDGTVWRWDRKSD